MKNPLRLSIGVALLLATLLYILDFSTHKPPAAVPDAPEQSSHKTTNTPLSQLALNQRILGTAVARPLNGREQQLAERIANATRQSNPVGVFSYDILPEKSGKRQSVPTAKLSDPQLKTLQKLRFGIAKELEFRADPTDSTIRLLASPVLGTDLAVQSKETLSPSEKVIRFIEEYRELFLLSDPRTELVVRKIEAAADNSVIIRLDQRYAGLEVWPGQITANTSPAGLLTVVTGTYAPTPSTLSLTPRITKESATAAARRHLLRTSPLPQLEVQEPTLKIFADKGHPAELAFDIVIRSAGRADRVFVSADSGEVLLTVPEICSAAVTTVAPDLFNQPRTISVWAGGAPVRFEMVDTSKAMYSDSTKNGVIIIYNGSISSRPISSSPALTSGFDPVAVSAAYNLGKAYDLFETTYGRRSFDGNGSSIRSLIRQLDEKTGGPLDNAYWNGNNLTMSFGDADAYAGATDVVGHEFTHAVIQFTARLVYNNDSGALNEAFSDIMGEALERFVHGTNDWLVGSQLRTHFRDMKAPQTKSQPAKMSQYKRTAADNGGVHINSGIVNHAFYLLAEGLPGGGIGFDDARDTFFHALSSKLNSRSDFHDLRSACLLSATEKFGPGSEQVTKTRQAFDAVEIFDASPTESVENLTPPSGSDSYLIAYKAVNGNTYLGRREAVMGDGNSITPISATPMATNTRASVSGDGSFAAFVSLTKDVVLANTNGTADSALGLPGFFNSVALSADRNYFACIARDTTTGLAMNSIIRIDMNTFKGEAIDLHLPLLDGPSSTVITTVDEIDLSPDGQIALFDGFARTLLGDGTVVQGWSLFGVDLKTKAIFSLLGPLKNINISDPTFARTSHQRIACEANNGTSSIVMAIDLIEGQVGLIREHTPASLFHAYPRFSAADDFVVFTDQYFSFLTSSYQPTVSRILLQGDQISSTGPVLPLQQSAAQGLSYRRGFFAGAPTLSVSAVTSSIGSGETGTFRISRNSGDQAIRVPLSFKMLGSARPSIDYTNVPLSATIPAGARFVDVTIQAIASPGGGTRSLTLSLDPKYHYLVSPSEADATMMISSQTIETHPVSQEARIGSTVTLTVGTVGTGPFSYEWRRNNTAVASGNLSTLTLANLQPSDAGVYTVYVSSPQGIITSRPAVIGILLPEGTKVIGSAYEFGANIKHPNGATYDQLLLSGNAATFAADPGQTTRLSFIDLNNDIVQLEFSGSGAVTIQLAGASGPAAPLHYNQDVHYMKGHASLIVAGGNESTHLGIYTVGTATNGNPSLYLPNITYDGFADLGYIALTSPVSRFGGIYLGSTELSASAGFTGILAEEVRFGGPLNLHNISASGNASPYLLTGTIGTGRITITGGDLFQPNNRPITVGDAQKVFMAAGSNSHGVQIPAQLNRGRLERNGQDFTDALIQNP